MRDRVTLADLEGRLDECDRLAAAVVPILAEHLPEIDDEARHEAAYNLAERHAFPDAEHRLAGGAADRAALEAYLHALWATRRAHAALPHRLKELVAHDPEMPARPHKEPNRYRALAGAAEAANMAGDHATARRLARDVV